MKKNQKIILTLFVIVSVVIIAVALIFVPRRLLKDNEEFEPNIIYIYTSNGSSPQAMELEESDQKELEKIFQKYHFYLYPNIKGLIYEDVCLWDEAESQYYISWIGSQKDYMTREWELQISDNTAYLMSYNYFYKIYNNKEFVKEVDSLLSKYYEKPLSH